MNTLRVLGVQVTRIAGEQVLAELAAPSALSPRHLCFVNAHSLNLAFTDASFRASLSRASLVLNDGIGLQLAAKMRGTAFPENLNGSDFMLRLLDLAASKSWRVYFYGAPPGVAEEAANRLCKRIPGLIVAGVTHGYSEKSAPAIVAAIADARSDFLIVALGQPRQEEWLDAHLGFTGCHLGVGVGAFLDFTAGRVARAPRWMNSLGVEWLYRLSLEPRRLWRRYLIGNPLFLWRAWTHRNFERFAVRGRHPRVD